MAKQNMVTAFGKAVYPKITEPDTHGDFADGKYKTYLELDPKDLATFKRDLSAWVKGQKFKVKDPKMPFKTLKDGREVLGASSKYAPVVGDRFKKPLEDGVRIGGGSTIRLAVEPYNYDKGVSLRLKKVQVLELVSAGGLDEFDDVDDGFDNGGDEPNDDLDI